MSNVMYMIAAEAGITQLGYLTHDPSCVPVFPNLEKTEEEKAKEAEEE